MKQSEQDFLAMLSKKALQQAEIEKSSPIPQFLRPFFSVVGQKYWLMLLLMSLVISIPLSIWFFPIVYGRVTGL